MYFCEAFPDILVYGRFLIEENHHSQGGNDKNRITIQHPSLAQVSKVT